MQLKGNARRLNSNATTPSASSKAGSVMAKMTVETDLTNPTTARIESARQTTSSVNPVAAFPSLGSVTETTTVLVMKMSQKLATELIWSNQTRTGTKIDHCVMTTVFTEESVSSQPSLRLPFVHVLGTLLAQDVKTSCLLPFLTK